jgi:shikimate dehydrogenase
MHFAVVGAPIAHSRSPIMHRAWYRHRAIDADYEAIESRNLQQTLHDHADFCGFSVTMPLKEQALALADTRDDSAERTGVANTLVRDGDLWRAHNTDATGFRDLLSAAGFERVGRATVIGAGATARSAVDALAGRADEITVLSRDRSRSAAVLNLAPEARWSAWEAAADALAAEIVINTTPAHACDGLPVGAGTLVEVVYSPWPTELASRWQGRVLDGLELLARQAARQVELFFPASFAGTGDVEDAYAVMLAAARRA